jgi:RimJ/RimL family protein N-acetyltransferase
MPWTISEDLDEFDRAAGPFLRERSARNTVALTIIQTLHTDGLHAFGPGDPMFGWWQPPGGAVAAAFLQSPPYPLLIVSDAPAGAVRDLADQLAAAARPLPGVNSAEPAAREFAGQWQQRTGAAAAVHQRNRLYRLAGLTDPSPVPGGRARVAGRADRDLLVAWWAAFMREAGQLAEGDPGLMADSRLAHDGITVWEDGGRPVSMAGVSRQVAGTARVGPVYTPPELRGRGYGGAVTAAVTRAALDAGATEVVLFTDLANPTSNALYQRLGYQPVEDRVILSFSS